MGTPRIVLAAVLLGASALDGCSSPPPHYSDDAPLTVADLGDRSVIGRLGVPLGTTTEISATVVDGSETRMKGYQGVTLLRVTDAGGCPLAKPPLMRFHTPSFAGVDLADRDVGMTIRLVAYEAGAFEGIPDDLPPDVGVWQDHPFGFETWLVVLAKRP